MVAESVPSHKFFKTMKERFLYSCLFLGILGCSEPKVDSMANDSAYFSGSKSELINKQWRLESYETGTPTNTAIMEFKTHKSSNGKGYILSGKSAVNFYEANYELSEVNEIKVHHLFITEIAGNQAESAFEKDFFMRVSTVENYKINHNELELSNSKGMTMRFVSNK